MSGFSREIVGPIACFGSRGEDGRGLVVGRSPWIWGLARGAADFIPREVQRRDRIVTLTWVLSAVVIVTILSNVSRFVAQYYVALGTLRGVMDMRRSLYRKLLRLPMDFFSRDVSDIVSRFVQDPRARRFPRRSEVPNFGRR